MTTTNRAEYVSLTDTAKQLRAALAKTFPGVAFSVRSRRYAGGASIDVYYTDGPATAAVEKVTRLYQGAGFDGMIDLQYSVGHYVAPDGHVSPVADVAGTNGSVPPQKGIRNHDEAKLVRWGANYVFARHSYTNEEARFAAAEAYIREHCRIEGDRFGCQWVPDLAHSMVWQSAEGDSLETMFRRTIMREEID